MGGDLVFVAQPQTSTIIVLSATGGLVDELGGSGMGPGEYQRISHITADPSGGVWVTDPALGRVTRVARDGSIQTWPVRPREGGPGIQAQVVASIDSTWVITDHVTDAYAVVDGLVPNLPLASVRTSDFESFVLENRPTAGTVLALRNEGQQRRGVFAPHPYSPAPLWALDRPDQSVVIVDRFATRVDSDFRLSLRKVSLRGEEIWRRVISVEQVPIPSATKDSILEFWTDVAVRANGVQVASPREARALASEAIAFPDAAAAAEEIVVGNDGRVWLRVASSSNDEAVWLIFTPDGRDAGVVLLPDSFTAMAADEERIVGVEHDSLEIPYVVSLLVGPL